MSTRPQAESEGKGHETKDADVTSIALIAVGLLLVILFVQLTVWMTLRHWRDRENTKEDGAAPMVESGKLFPEPRLQVDPALDLANMRVRDARELDTFGWIDRKAGTLRIPIDRAMQLIAERGLPEVGKNQTPLGLMQARPAATAAPKKHRTRY